MSTIVGNIADHNNCIEFLRRYYPPEKFPGIAEQCLIELKCKMTETLSMYLSRFGVESSCAQYIEMYDDQFRNNFFLEIFMGILELKSEIDLNNTTKCYLDPNGTLTIKQQGDANGK